MAYKYSIGQPFIYPNNSLGFAENFLNMMFSVPCEPYKVSPVIARAMEKIMILHADHEQNASTSTVRMVASTDVTPYAAIVSGVAALWGPLHGGANEAVIKMLEEIKSIHDVQNYIEKVKLKQVKLMGFGHRVYKNYDPRAKLIKQSCDLVLDVFSHNSNESEKLAIARALEQYALQDDYFTSRKLFPNVDFYSGIIYKALDVPPQFFTVMFAMARIAGWCTQMNEFYGEPRKISRPRQLYIGNKVAQ
jgi:citrate synthase